MPKYAKIVAGEIVNIELWESTPPTEVGVIYMPFIKARALGIPRKTKTKPETHIDYNGKTFDSSDISTIAFMAVAISVNGDATGEEVFDINGEPYVFSDNNDFKQFIGTIMGKLKNKRKSK